ncbi:MAG: hypothetical protein O7D91_03775 [Planctomycetota bacterium]|nr:hypothetical protein [Planctomycetota bacterium]
MPASARLWFLRIEIRLDAKMNTTRKIGKKTKNDKPGKTSPRGGARQKTIDKLVSIVSQEIDDRLGPNSTFEQRRDAEAELLSETLWKREDDDLRKSISDTDALEVDGKRYARLGQPSSATYYGRWGPHSVNEPLYREVGVRNGPTIKPLELRVGIVARRMTPDLARIVGELSAGDNSRDVERLMRTVGLVPPSRSFIEKRVKVMAAELAQQVDALEQVSRATTAVPEQTASISCGLDRFSVRMEEPASPEADNGPKRQRRTKLYKRKPPTPKEYHYRKAWVGSVSVYDKEGHELHTWRYATEADAEPKQLAERVSEDVAWVLRSHPGIPVQCVQDGAPELRALPEALSRALPDEAEVCELIDFEHLMMGYLDKVVDACEPGDPHNMKSWYRGELLRDDAAIDRIWRGLRERGKRLRDSSSTAARQAVASALSYIRHRKKKMRYASHHAENRTIGSGATESACWTMQQRVKRPAQSWSVPGLRGTLTIRSLVVSERWKSAWKPYAAAHRKEVRSIA